jgi:hypothetical protein
VRVEAVDDGANRHSRVIAVQQIEVDAGRLQAFQALGQVLW